MRSYARICEGEVQELFSTDGDISEMFHPDMVWVDVSDFEKSPAVGWLAVESSGSWSLSAPVPHQKSEAELIYEALAQRDTLLAISNEATIGMADAYLAGLLDEEDEAKFKTFAGYKLALNKIDQQSGYPSSIDWPAYPTLPPEPGKG
ncbi:tail fiber assembly protein [Pseudomonas sp. R4-83]|uniref:tail fiber assembly protein n=1 Tax=unclassified Pseudomonas TaxID=196821 RepID=UPI003DA8FDC9